MSKVQSFKAKVRSKFKPGETKERLARAGATAVDGLQLILRVFEGPADVVGVPGLKIGIQGLNFVIDVIKKTSQNADDLEQLADSIMKLQSVLEKSTNAAAAPPPAMQERLNLLLSEWDTITAGVKKLASRGVMGRTLNYISDAASINSSIQQISQSIERFMIGTMLTIEFCLDDHVHFMRNVATQIEGKIDHVQETIDDGLQGMMARLDLKDGLPPMVFSAAFECLDPQKVSRCFKETRVHVLDQLDSWLDGDDTSDSVPVFWVSGLGGTGKTTIAYTFADSCKRRGIPVKSFFCSRDFAERSNPKLIFTSIANQLGQAFPAFGDQLTEVLRTQPHLSTASVPFQFEELIIKPLRTTRDSLSLCLVVIDALDECKDESTTSIILSSLSRHVAEISPLKVLVTSRPEQSIISAFSARENGLNVASQRLALHELELGVVEQDIKLYLSSNLRDVAERYRLDAFWPGKDDIQALADLSSGLFIFAATSIKFVEDKNDSDPLSQLGRLLGGNGLTANVQSSPHHHLDKLYMQVLTHAFPHISVQLSGRLKMILGSIVFLQEPLSIDSLSTLLGLTSAVGRQTLLHLSSILLVPETDTQPIQLHHPSFADFITDSRRCTDVNYIVDSVKQHTLLAARCLQAMNSLKQDICETKFPSRLNGEIPDLPTRIMANIPLHMQYACRHWTYHLTHGLVSDTLLDLLKEFCNKHLLHWIEVCSLLGELRNALLGIHSAHKLLKEQSFSSLSNVKPLLSDGERFIRDFFYVIDASALQVYCSALHFTPRKTILWKVYKNSKISLGDSYPGLDGSWSTCLQTIECRSSMVTSMALSPDGTQLVSGSREKSVWLWDVISGAHLNILEGHSDVVRSVAFSPDGTRLVSGSSDTTLRLWDAISGAHLNTLKGHSDSIISVAFSPDGTQLVSGSDDKTLKLWDAVSGDHLNTLKGHSDSVTSVAFSPDGTRIVSGSDDKTLWLWGTANGAHLNTLKGHSDSITSVAFSPDGTRIVSGSDDNTLQLWDAVSGAHLNTLKGHSDSVKSVAFSSDGTHIVSGSDDETLRLWDAASGVHLNYFNGHSHCVTFVAFSPDGTQLVSGSFDCTLRLWDAVSGAHLHTPKVHSHDDDVTCLAFSPNGTRLVSGSYDKILQVWDGVNGAYLKTLKGHSKSVMAVAFSPDGTRLVSGSDDKTLRLWDAVTGVPLNTLKGHSHFIRCVAFSQDSMRLVSACEDNTLWLWDVASGLHHHTFSFFHFNLVKSVGFSMDCTEILSIHEDLTCQSLNLSTGWQTIISIDNIPASIHSIQEVDITNGWIMFTNLLQRLCWIPVSYRPSTPDCWATHGSRIAIGSRDGGIIILDISALNTRDISCSMNTS